MWRPLPRLFTLLASWYLPQLAGDLLPCFSPSRQALWLKENEPEVFERAAVICEYQVSCMMTAAAGGGACSGSHVSPGVGGACFLICVGIAASE